MSVALVSEVLERFRFPPETSLRRGPFAVHPSPAFQWGRQWIPSGAKGLPAETCGAPKAIARTRAARRENGRGAPRRAPQESGTDASGAARDPEFRRRRAGRDGGADARPGSPVRRDQPEPERFPGRNAAARNELISGGVNRGHRHAHLLAEGQGVVLGDRRCGTVRPRKEAGARRGRDGKRPERSLPERRGTPNQAETRRSRDRGTEGLPGVSGTPRTGARREEG